MKLTKEQRIDMIRAIIENDSEQLYKPRDIFSAYYYGIPPYKNMKDIELIEYFNDSEIEIPKQENLTLLCVNKECIYPQKGEYEYCSDICMNEDNK